MAQKRPEEITLKFIDDIQTREARIADFLGAKIIVNRNVSPVDSPFSFSSKMTAERIPENAGVVLDVGTGTGVQAILAAQRGAQKVIAIDIDERALANAKENIVYHNLENVIEIRKSDLFNNIKEGEKFDLIISQLPFADVDYESEVGHFLFDPDFQLHDRLLREAGKYLTEKGQIYISSGDVANEDCLIKLIHQYSYRISSVEEETYQNLKWKLYRIEVPRVS